MRKVLIILTISFLTACSKSSDIEACRFTFLAQSYAKTIEINECIKIYKEIEAIKSKSDVDNETLLEGSSISLYFEFVDSENENYLLNPDGTLLYYIQDVQYSVKMSKEFFVQLKENIEQ